MKKLFYFAFLLKFWVQTIDNTELIACKQELGCIFKQNYQFSLWKINFYHRYVFLSYSLKINIGILPVNLAWQWRQSVFYHKMGSFCIYKQLKRISVLCYGEFMESAILHNISLSFSVVYKCRRIPSYYLKYTLTSLSSKVDREYTYTGIIAFFYIKGKQRIVWYIGEFSIIFPSYP